MSDPPHAVVTGTEETAAAFQKLSGQIANDLVPAARVAALGAEGARSRAPVVTGELASQYSVQDRYVVNPTSYAAYVEFGTRNMDAQYPIQLTLDALGPQAEEIYSQWVKEQASGAGFTANTG